MLWIDGHPVAAAEPLDRGLEFGDGLFETMAVVSGRVRLLDRHLHRLSRGCERLRLHTPDLDALREQIQVAAATLDGARIVCLSTPIAASPRLAGLKHLNRLEQVLLRDDVAQQGVDEGLVADTAGRVISGAMTNVFLVIEGVVVTPAVEHCGIEGVMRGAVVDHLARRGTPVVVRDVALAEVAVASELFLTNALLGVWPVIELDGRPLPIGPWARRLQTEIAQWAE